jgi:nitroreductase
MNEVITCILERRSIRKYKPEQIPESALQAIICAGTYAPSAGGRQSPYIVVCQNETINAELGKINKAAFKGRMSTETSYISKEQPSIADNADLPSGFYGAPTVITLFGPKGFLNAQADCYVMAENMVLAAHSLGIGSCIVARAGDTFASGFGQQLQKEWGINKDYEAHVHITLGYFDGEPPAAKPRKPDKVKRIG